MDSGMDTMMSQSLLETVQLIPVFNYLNILSDFLFIENYLTEDNQTKQIPIVNALYEYLEDHRNIQFMKINLIRSLLEGSDLYGAKGNENFEVVFVNAMFDYIISSLVFDKYGNIYGFLVDVFRKAENSQIDHVLKLIKENLQCASFENEFGDRSTLSTLSVKRIYNDIILPLFPQPKKNLSLCSLDYIYAQAGSMFLKPARINTAYYSDLKNSGSSNRDENDLFNEYLITGHVIARLIFAKKTKFNIQKAFALSALTYYIFSSKYLFAYENVANIISDPGFWQKAYTHLFQHKILPFGDAIDQLKDDRKLQMHVMLSSFQSRNEVAKIFINFYCHNDNRTSAMLLFTYLKNLEKFECKSGVPLPNLNLWYMNQINEFKEIYKAYDLELVQSAFGSFLINYFQEAEVTIKLLPPNDNVQFADFSNSKYLPYDILEIFFLENKTYNYYALVRENYNLTLISNATNSQVFEEKVGSSAYALRNNRGSVILKLSDDHINTFWENLMQYKLTRLQSYLQFLDVNQKQDSWKSEWWKEFGLSLVPHYPCLLNTHDIYYKKGVCEFNKISFFDKFQEDISAKIINTNVQSLLSSLDATVLSVFLENVCREAVNDFEQVDVNGSSILSKLNGEKLFQDISLHVEEPAFQVTFSTENDLGLLEKIISALRERTLLSLSSVQNDLEMMKGLKSNTFRSVGAVGEHKRRLMYINTLNNVSGTGYGYKFFFVSENVTEIAQLRTDYEFKEEKLVLRIQDSTKGEKQYIKINNASLKPEPMEVMYEVNNQLRNKLINVLFFGISTNDDDKLCYIDAHFEISENFGICSRQELLYEKLSWEQKAMKFVKTSTNLSEELIHKTFKKYTFPDNETIFHFVENWTLSENLAEPGWGKMYIIDNPDLLNDLRYKMRFENHDVSDYDGRFRINSIYSHRERCKIEQDQPVEKIIRDFNDKKNYYSVTFEDYYAIRNFATTGYRRITGDTREAKLMKFALYKLAIRQFEDPIKDYELKLFIVENKPIGINNQKYFKDDLILQKFKLASTSLEAATRFAVYPKFKFINVVYEMEFRGPYARVKIDQFYKSKEKKVILLPGCEFLIEDRIIEIIEGLGNVLKLKLRYKHNIEKHEVYKNIMKEIGKIQF